MKPFTLREATWQDLEGIYTVFSETELIHRIAHPEIFRAVKNPQVTQEYLKDAIADPSAAIFLAENAGVILGAIHCRLQTSPENPVLVPRKYALIENIAVTQDYQKSGVGSALMKRATQWAKALGASSLELTVWEFNQTARDFYLNQGFRAIHQRMSKDLE